MSTLIAAVERAVEPLLLLYYSMLTHLKTRLLQACCAQGAMNPNTSHLENIRLMKKTCPTDAPINTAQRRNA
jgi:hypothetical protein